MVDLAAPFLLTIAAVTALVAAARVIRIRAPARGNAGAERERRARELGWAYDQTAFGSTLFTLRGEAQGIKWKARYRAEPGDGAKRHALMWMTRSVQGSATELRIVGRERHAEAKPQPAAVLEKLSHGLSSARDIATAQARSDFIERTPPAETGSAAFRERYVVLARNQRLARALIDPTLEALLMQWPQRPDDRPETVVSIWLDWQGLRIDVDAAWTSMHDIEHVVAIGLALASGYRRHAATPGVTQWLPSRPGHAT